MPLRIPLEKDFVSRLETSPWEEFRATLLLECHYFPMPEWLQPNNTPGNFQESEPYPHSGHESVPLLLTVTRTNHDRCRAQGCAFFGIPIRPSTFHFPCIYRG